MPRGRAFKPLSHGCICVCVVSFRKDERSGKSVAYDACCNSIANVTGLLKANECCIRNKFYLFTKLNEYPTLCLISVAPALKAR
jgi:hypothetical protein